MKPTERQIEEITDLYNRYDGDCEKSMAVALEHWESIRPKDDTDRWIPLSERRPTEVDADEHGFVMSLRRNRVAWHTGLSEMTEHTTHWRRTNLPPKEPTPEEIEEREITAAWQESDDFDDTLDAFKAGWLACKSKTTKP